MKSALRFLRILFGTAGIAFLGWGAFQAWEKTALYRTPTWSLMAIAMVLTAAAFAFAAKSWASLFEEQSQSKIIAAYLIGQLGKYIPGYFWQAAGQVSLTKSGGVSLRRATSAYAIHALIQVCAATIVGFLAAVGLNMDQKSILIWSAVTVGLHVMMFPKGRAAFVSGISRVIRRDVAELSLPSNHGIARAYAWSVGAMLLVGSAFGVLFMNGNYSLILPAAGAYSLAWAIGFAAIIFPAGLGAREAALIFLISPIAATGEVMPAAIFFRVLSMLADLILAGFAFAPKLKIGKDRTN
jgi:glycosyltransferase 2 family protein